MDTNINSTKRTDIYSVDPRNVVVVDNFNVRRDFAIDELKEQIKLQGVLNPITVVPFKDENGDEKYRLVDGERRLRATLAAISEVQTSSASKRFSCLETRKKKICSSSR